MGVTDQFPNIPTSDEIQEAIYLPDAEVITEEPREDTFILIQRCRHGKKVFIKVDSNEVTPGVSLLFVGISNKSCPTCEETVRANLMVLGEADDGETLH